MSNLPSPGKYRARCTARPFYPEPGESGSIMIHIPCELTNSEVPYSGVAKTVFVKKDGSLMKKTIQAIALIFGIEQPANLFFVDDIEDESELIGKEFEVAGTIGEFTPEGAESPIQTFELSWPTPIGGMGASPITAETRKEMLTKFGSKFKALFGSAAKPASTPAKSAPSAPAKPAVKPAVSGPPGRKSTAVVARTSSQNEVWDALDEQNKASDEPLGEDEVAQKYYDAIDAVVPEGSTKPETLTPAQWGKVAESLGV